MATEEEDKHLEIASRVAAFAMQVVFAFQTGPKAWPYVGQLDLLSALNAVGCIAAVVLCTLDLRQLVVRKREPGVFLYLWTLLIVGRFGPEAWPIAEDGEGVFIAVVVVASVVAATGTFVYDIRQRRTGKTAPVDVRTSTTPRGGE